MTGATKARLCSRCRGPVPAPNRTCLPCKQTRASAWRRRNPEKMRAYRRQEQAKPDFARRKFLRKHGMTPGRFEELFEAQGRACAICRTDTPTGTGWHIDHDHACCPRGKETRCGRCFRGILCHGCNVGLGMFADDPTRLDAAIGYLRRT